MKVQVESRENAENVHVTAAEITSKKRKHADRGLYKWIVVFGSFMCFLILGGIDRSEGIFYLKFIDRFDKSAQATAWPGSLAMSLRLIFAPVSTIVSNRFSGRTTIITGSILLSVTSVVSGFAPSLAFLYFSFGIVGGLGRSFTYCPGLVIVGQYFAERSGPAVGMAVAGAGAGTIVLPLILTILFDNYGFAGAFLMLAGVTLNLCVFGALLRPFKPRHTTLNVQRQHQTEDNEPDDFDLKPLETQSGHDNYGFSKNNGPVDSNNSKTNCITANYLQKESCNGNEKPNEPESSSRGTKESDAKTPRFLEISLLKNPSFLLYCISIALFTSAFKAAYTFLPALAQSRGCTGSQTAYLLSLSGVLDTAGRVLGGFLLDLNRVRIFRPYLYSVLLILLSLISFVFPVLYGFWQFVLVTSIYGALTGVYVAQKSVILVDILGMDTLSSSCGILLLSQGLGSITGPPLSGLLKDVFDDYAMAFYLGGGMLAVAAAVMVASNVFLFMQRLREAK